MQQEKTIKGAIFCHVINNKIDFQFKPSVTLGNQKWKGALPIFIAIAEAINIMKNSFKLLVNFNLLNIKNNKTENKKTEEVRAWVKKYFKEASEENKFFVSIIKGIKDNKLISNPIHILNQDVDEIVIKVPNIIDKKNKIL